MLQRASISRAFEAGAGRLDTPALCLLLVSTPSIVLPSLFIVAPPGPGHDRRRRLPPTSPGPAAFLPLTWLDQSP